MTLKSRINDLTIRKAWISVMRKLIHLLKLHPSSHPYISGDTFRSIADHIFDKDKIFYPHQVKRGDIIFVSSSRIKQYFSEVHPKIKFPYVLMTHNGDTNINHELTEKIDNKILHWFAQNALTQNRKVTPIPIGLENLSLNQNGNVNNFDKLRAKKVNKIPRILYGFNIETNPIERRRAHDCLKKSQVSDEIEEPLSPLQYLNKLNNYKFIASPPGNGEDCHRTWEALYLGVIPIVKKTNLTTYFKSIGIPLLLIDDWNDVLIYDEKSLEEIYSGLKNDFLNKKIWIQPWEEGVKKFSNYFHPDAKYE
jgi:hypothetical protein